MSDDGTDSAEKRGKDLKSKAKVLSISSYPEDRDVFNALKRYLEDATGKTISISQVYRTALYAAKKDEAFLAVVTPEPLSTFFQKLAEEGREKRRQPARQGTLRRSVVGRGE